MASLEAWTWQQWAHFAQGTAQRGSDTSDYGLSEPHQDLFSGSWNSTGTAFFHANTPTFSVARDNTASMTDLADDIVASSQPFEDSEEDLVVLRIEARRILKALTVTVRHLKRKHRELRILGAGTSAHNKEN
ncbi:hypothetical protein B0H16DRAFT_1455378 [Mycena metata]|uniref:Uncharacterized protein n=1 Tax=Mycena metata TaxID=1033252 RepID=A0AAD7JGM2_9AGAR|nr:hypothetical protein B0H16DRAFT_1455378 [Mycena metata]